MISSNKIHSRRLNSLFLVGTMLGGFSAPLYAQAAASDAAPVAPPAPAAAPAVAPAPAPAAAGVIRSLQVKGAERLEPETIRAYANLTPGQTYTAETLDAALKDLYATELFADVVISGADTGNLLITVRENPVINRIVLEGNKKIKDDKITPEIRLAPRQIFTRSKVRADVERIIELYKRQGRFAATVDPQVVQLDQNRVDLVFAIHEGDKSKVRAINIIGNKEFGAGRLRKEMYTKEAGGILGLLKQNDSYDPDRLAADQQKLRAFYLTQGYADFRVVSALAELTPDRRDFVITYVVEEGPRYKFGTIEADSALRDFNDAEILKSVKIKSGDWFNAKRIEDVVTGLSEVAGAKGYAFAEVNPSYKRDADKKLMNVTFRIADSPRVYVERIDITGNTVTRDKVIRREFRLNEGDAFNSIKVKRSQDRIQSLGFFQEKLEVKQTEGSAPDRVVLGVGVEEKATGELQLSAGYSSLEQFVFAGSLSQRNFLGKGQIAQAGVNWSRYSRSVNLGFTEPYLFDRPISLGGEIYRRDYNSFNYVGTTRQTTYSQVSTGGGLRTGFALNEYMIAGARYSLVRDEITLNKDNFYTNGVCDPLKAGSYLCEELGGRITSAVGYSVSYDTTDSFRPTRGLRALFSQDVAGLGGDVRYIRTRGDVTRFAQLPRGFILSGHLEGGYITAYGTNRNPLRDPIRITDRFFGTDLRGFDIRGIGPRVQRVFYNDAGTLVTDKATVSDGLGGHAYYQGRVEVEFPTSSGLRSLGIRPSAYVDFGSLWGLSTPQLNDGTIGATCTLPATTTNPAVVTTVAPGVVCPTGYSRLNGYREFFLGNSPKPRVSIGIGANWNSPFGPLRLDLARALVKQDGDKTKLFSFNVGTQF
ncbi:MAG: outer membrane protein assembly factor BamA [Sphingomicrobium sp.]